MSDAESNTPTDKPTSEITKPSEITRNEKIILGILLCILVLLLFAIAQKILPHRLELAPGNNRLMVAARRYHLRLLTDSIQYTYSLDQSKKTDIELFSSLPKSAELSPNGQWIVFSTSESEIYVMRTDGTQQTRVPIPHGGRNPTWSPDGKQIAFLGYEGKTGIHIINVECLLRGDSCTPAPRLLIESPAGYPFTFLDWSPDGTKIAYNGPALSRISVIHADGQSLPGMVPHRSYAFDGTLSDPQYSPDGTKIVVICRGPISGVCVMNRDGTNIVYLKKDTAGEYASQPTWSPDGQMVAFISTSLKHKIPQICWPDGCSSILRPSSVFVMNADGSGLTRLPFRDDVVIEWLFWYP